VETVRKTVRTTVPELIPGPFCVETQGNHRMAPDKFRERSAGRIEPSQEIILKIISHNSRNFPEDTPQSCFRSKNNHSSLFLSKEKISLYLVNFIPPRSDPDPFLWTCTPDELERNPRKSSSASSAAFPSHFYADGPCSFSEVGPTGRRSDLWAIHLRGSLRGQSTGLFLWRRCMTVPCCFLARYVNGGRNKFNTTNRNK